MPRQARIDARVPCTILSCAESKERGFSRTAKTGTMGISRLHPKASQRQGTLYEILCRCRLLQELGEMQKIVTGEIDGPRQVINKAFNPSRIKIESVDIVRQMPEHPEIIQSLPCLSRDDSRPNAGYLIGHLLKKRFMPLFTSRDRSVYGLGNCLKDSFHSLIETLQIKPYAAQVVFGPSIPFATSSTHVP